jgi:hypothetical protein
VFVLAAAMAAVVGWLVWRIWLQSNGRWSMDQAESVIRFRYAPVRTPGELVNAFDRFVLARFGRKADWWDARRAEARVRAGDLRQVSDSRLNELVSSYEEARYSPTAEEWSGERLDRLNETLRDLASVDGDAPEQAQHGADV